MGAVIRGNCLLGGIRCLVHLLDLGVSLEPAFGRRAFFHQRVGIAIDQLEIRFLAGLNGAAPATSTFFACWACWARLCFLERLTKEVTSRMTRSLFLAMVAALAP